MHKNSTIGQRGGAFPRYDRAHVKEVGAYSLPLLAAAGGEERASPFETDLPAQSNFN